ALNLSTRMRVLTDANVCIDGFIVTGSAPKQVLLRGIGPSLANFGVPNPLADPVMELHGPTGFLTITNDNWMDAPNRAAIEATGLAPTNDLESAILVTLPPGPYTAIVKGKNNGVGVGWVEVYDIANAGGTPVPTATATATFTPGGASPTPTPAPSASASPSAGPCVENWDSVTAPALPTGWTATNPDPGDGVLWVTTTVTPETPPNDAFVGDQNGISDKVLDRAGVTITSTSPMMSFRNNFNTEMSGGTFWDGYVLEVSAPGISGGDFLDIT